MTDGDLIRRLTELRKRYNKGEIGRAELEREKARLLGKEPPEGPAAPASSAAGEAQTGAETSEPPRPEAALPDPEHIAVGPPTLPAEGPRQGVFEADEDLGQPPPPLGEQAEEALLWRFSSRGEVSEAMSRAEVVERCHRDSGGFVWQPGWERWVAALEALQRLAGAEGLEAPAPSFAAVGGGCPLCGRPMNQPRPLYGASVCSRCSSSFSSRRATAYLIDSVVFWFLSLVGLVMIGAFASAGGMRPYEARSLLNVLAWTLCPFVFLLKDGFFGGRSLGRGMLGLRVTRWPSGRPAGPLQSFMRNLPLLIPFMPLVVAFSLGKGPRLGDGWAGTRVVLRKHETNGVFRE